MIEVWGYRSLNRFCVILLLLLLNGAFASSYADDVVSFYRNCGTLCGSGELYQGYILKVNSDQDIRLAQADMFEGLIEDKVTAKKTSKVEDTIAAEGYSTTKKVLEPMFNKYAGSNPNGDAGGSGGESGGNTGGDTG